MMHSDSTEEWFWIYRTGYEANGVAVFGSLTEIAEAIEFVNRIRRNHGLTRIQSRLDDGRHLRYQLGYETAANRIYRVYGNKQHA